MKIFFLYLISLLSYTKTICQDNYVDSLERLLAVAKPDSNKVLLLANLSGAYAWTKPDSTIIFAQEGLKLSNQINYHNAEGVLKHTMGMALWILGDYLKANELMIEALKHAESKNDFGFMLGIYSGLSSNSRDKGDYKEALKFISSEDSLNKARHVCNDCFETNMIRGAIYVEMDMIDSALYYLTQVPENGYTLWLLGRAQEKRGDEKLAYKYYLKSISSFLLNGINPKDLSNTYKSLALLFKKKGDIDSCIYYAKKGYDIAREGSYTKGLLETELLLSNAYEKTDARQALRYYKLASVAKDSLFNQEKLIQGLNSKYNEQLQQQKAESANLVYRNKLKLYVLVAVILVILLVAFLLARNVRHKQKAYSLLQKQKTEIDFQKTKVEKTLEDLKIAQAQLIQSEKMASLGELTAGIAHEIQNPLNFVNNFSEVNKELLTEISDELDKGNIKEAQTITRDVIENEGKINHHGKRADSIVKGMLQHSRVSTGQKEPTNINALADEYLRLAYHGMRTKDKSFNATLETDFDSDIGKINIVPQDIGRALLNLFNNAFYAVAEKKKQHEDYNPAVSVTTKKQNEKVLISVKDNGNGIPQKVLDKIFQPFFTTKPTGQGTGLGLSLSYDIIKAHGGEIKLETREGEGAEFIISLPAKENL